MEYSIELHLSAQFAQDNNWDFHESRVMEWAKAWVPKFTSSITPFLPCLGWLPEFNGNGMMDIPVIPQKM